jgi:hypothetical protein
VRGDKTSNQNQRTIGPCQRHHHPIGFFVLALLIVESTLAIVLSCSKLTAEHVWEGFKWMVWVLAGVVIIVTLFASINPRNLLYGKEEHREPLLERSALKDQIEPHSHQDHAGSKRIT